MDEYIHSHLKSNGYTQVAMRHADYYLKRLAEAGQLKKGWTLLLFNLANSQKYFLDDLKLLKTFVESAVEREQFEASITLLQRLAHSPETEEKYRKILKDKATEIATTKLHDPSLAK